MLLYGLLLNQIDDVYAVMNKKMLGGMNRSKFFEWVEGCEVFETSNVGEYFFSSNEKDKFFSDDYPNIRPPFTYMWIERGPVESVNVGGKSIHVDQDHPANMRVGTLIASEEHENEILLNLTAFIQKNKKVKWVPVFWGIRITKYGDIIKPFNDDRWYVGMTPKGVMENFPIVARDLTESITSFIGYALMSLSFLNCKNVSVEGHNTSDNYRSMSIRTSKASIRYHVLNIEPMRHILRTEGNSETVGDRKSLHICRGHFKTFGPEKRLFGKFEGTYWWASQVRGDPSRGAVVKDYSVNPPTDTPPNNGVQPTRPAAQIER